MYSIRQIDFIKQSFFKENMLHWVTFAKNTCIHHVLMPSWLIYDSVNAVCSGGEAPT